MRNADEEADANEPLISGEDDTHQQLRRDTAARHSQAEFSLRSAGKVVWLLTLSAGISGLLFGCE